MFNTQSDYRSLMVLVWMAATRELIMNPHTQKLLTHNYISQNYRMPFSHVGTCSGDTIHTLLTITRILNIEKFTQG